MKGKKMFKKVLLLLGVVITLTYSDCLDWFGSNEGFNVGDVVQFNNKSYICIRSGNQWSDPTNTWFWSETDAICNGENDLVGREIFSEFYPVPSGEPGNYHSKKLVIVPEYDMKMTINAYFSRNFDPVKKHLIIVSGSSFDYRHSTPAVSTDEYGHGKMEAYLKKGESYDLYFNSVLCSGYYKMKVTYDIVPCEFTERPSFMTDIIE